MVLLHLGTCRSLPARLRRRLTKFLVEEKGFNSERVSRGIEKLKKARGA